MASNRDKEVVEEENRRRPGHINLRQRQEDISRNTKKPWQPWSTKYSPTRSDKEQTRSDHAATATPDGDDENKSTDDDDDDTLDPAFLFIRFNMDSMNFCKLIWIMEEHAVKSKGKKEGKYVIKDWGFKKALKAGTTEKDSTEVKYKCPQVKTNIKLNEKNPYISLRLQKDYGYIVLSTFDNLDFMLHELYERRIEKKFGKEIDFDCPAANEENDLSQYRVIKD